MGIQVGTIFKWFKPDDVLERCEDGQCVGIVTKVYDSDKESNVVVSVKWYDLCALHAEIDPNETGAYSLAYIWQIGQLY